MNLESSFTINNRMIGDDCEPYVVAEAGVNHNGDIEIAKRLAREAKEAGADAIKFQTFQAETLATTYAETAAYQRQRTAEVSQREMLKRLELKRSQHIEIMQFCKSIGITFFSTPFSKDDADFLNSLNVPAYKISSGDLVSLPFLEYVAEFSKPIILSTGMANMKEVHEAISLVSKYNKMIAVLQCTSSYPCDLQYINLNVISELRKFGYPVGFSDHSIGIGCAIIAAFEGSSIIEKHLTLDKNMEGPDHRASLEPNEFASLVQGVKDAFTVRLGGRQKLISLLEKYDRSTCDKIDLIMGSHDKELSPPEYEIALKARKSIVSKTELHKGLKVPNDLKAVLGVLFEFKRPGDGLRPKYLYDILGKTLTRDLKTDELIAMSDFQ